MRGKVPASCLAAARSWRTGHGPTTLGAGHGEDPEGRDAKPTTKKICFLKLCLAPGQRSVYFRHCSLYRILACGQGLERTGGARRGGSRWLARRSWACGPVPRATHSALPRGLLTARRCGQDSSSCGHLSCCVDRARSPRPATWGANGAETPTPREVGGGRSEMETRWGARQGLPRPRGPGEQRLQGPCPCQMKKRANDEG